MKIAILIAITNHPRSGKPIASDLASCELAQQLKEQLAHSSINYIHFGTTQPALEEYLGYGIGQIECYSANADFNTVHTAKMFENYDLIVLGNKASGGFASGMFGYQLALKLNRSLHANIVSFAENGTIAEQFLPAGYRRKIQIQLPCIITAHHSTNSTLRFSYSKQNSGAIIEHNKQPIATGKSPADYGWRHQKIRLQRKRLTLATNNSTAENRMQKAISATSGSQGKINRLDSQATAQEIWNILAQKKLVDS